MNLYAGPGVGKSTTAADLFVRMKKAGLEVELVTEWAKDGTYEGDVRRLNNVLYGVSQQYDRLDRLEGQVEWAITDSPLPLALAYAGPRWTDPSFRMMVRALLAIHDNRDFLLRRAKPFQTYGRNETFEQARKLDETVERIAHDFVPPHRLMELPGDDAAPAAILRKLGVKA